MEKKNIAFQIQFWTLLGPLTVLAIVLLLLLKGQTAALFLALLAALGIPLCLKWKKAGLGMALLLLAILMVTTYIYSFPADRFWYLGAAVAIGFAFFISYLSFEEVDEMVAHLHRESSCRWDQLWDLDEKWRQAQKRLEEERRFASLRVQRIEEEGKQSRQQARALEKLVEIVRQEISLAHRERCRLKGEVHESRKEALTLGQRLCEKAREENLLFPKNEGKIAQLQREVVVRCSQEESRYKQLREQFKEKKKALDSARLQLFHVNEELLRYKRWNSELVAFGEGESEVHFLCSSLLFQEEQEREIQELVKEIEALYEILQIIPKQVEDLGILK